MRQRIRHRSDRFHGRFHVSALHISNFHVGLRLALLLAVHTDSTASFVIRFWRPSDFLVSQVDLVQVNAEPVSNLSHDSIPFMIGDKVDDIY